MSSSTRAHRVTKWTRISVRVSLITCAALIATLGTAYPGQNMNADAIAQNAAIVGNAQSVATLTASPVELIALRTRGLDCNEAVADAPRAASGAASATNTDAGAGQFLRQGSRGKTMSRLLDVFMIAATAVRR